MRLNVRNDILFFIFFVFLFGHSAPAEIGSSNCVLRVYVNDPYSVIFVDEKIVGPPPQLIECSEREKKIVVKSSDGQVFSRLLTNRFNFDQTNSVLNVVFQRSRSEFVYQTGSPKPFEAGRYNRDIREDSVEATQNESSRSPRESASVEAPLADQVVKPEPIVIQQHYDLKKQWDGFYVQLFALKTIDSEKIKKDLGDTYYNHPALSDLLLCKGTIKKEKISLVLLGPYSDRSSAEKRRQSVGGPSFVISQPHCDGDLEKVVQ